MTNSHSDLASWSEIFRFAFEKRLPLIAAAVFGGLLGLGYYAIAERVYVAEVVLQPSVGSDQTSSSLNAVISRLGSVASIAGLEPSMGAKHDEALAVIQSRGFFEEFCEKTGFPEALRSRRDVNSIVGRFLSTSVTPGDAYETFHTDVMSVIDDKGRTTLRIRIRWNDPQLAADWANDIVALLNSRMRLAAAADSARNLAFLEKELQGTTLVETRQAIAFLIQRETERRMYANVTQDYGLRILDSAVTPDSEDFVSPALLLCLLVGTLASSTGAMFLQVRLEARNKAKVAARA